MSQVEREIEALQRQRQRHRLRGDSPNDFGIENQVDVLTACGAAAKSAFC